MKKYSYLKKPVSLKKIRVYNDLSKKEDFVLSSSSSFGFGEGSTSPSASFLAIKSSFLEGVININLLRGDDCLVLKGGYNGVSTTLTTRQPVLTGAPTKPNFIYFINKNYYDLGTQNLHLHDNLHGSGSSGTHHIFIPPLVAGCVFLTKNTLFPYACLFRFLLLPQFIIFRQKYDLQPTIQI